MNVENARYTPEEERLNYLTHGFAFVVSVIGLGFMAYKNWSHAHPFALVGSVVFCVGLMLSYLSSTVYHYTTEPTKKHQLRIIDHLCIYLLIAASYTPFTLVNLPPKIGIPIFIIIWSLSIFGVIFKFLIRHKMQSYQKIDTIIYVLLGTVAVLFIRPIITHIPPNGVQLLTIGGMMYLVGVYFYSNKKIQYNHAIWHVFVMLGGTAHFLAVWYFV